MKKYIYLVQGEAESIKKFLFLRKRKEIDVIFMTYDKPIDGAVYFPGSTWGQGRNKLLNLSLKSGKNYDYYIFIDDDVRFLKGSFEIFEKLLEKYSPAIAVPVFYPKTVDSVLGIGPSFHSKFFITLSEYQICKFADAQFMAFHKDVIHDNLVVPLQTQFDKISWWCTSSTQQILVFLLYGDAVLQFNNIVVANDAHRDYINYEFESIQKRWFEKQFLNPFEDPRVSALNLLAFNVLLANIRSRFKNDFVRCLKQFFNVFAKTLKYRALNCKSIPEKRILNILKSDSELRSQYRQAWGNNKNY